MPVHIRACVFVMIVTLIAFAMVRVPVTSSLVTESDFKRRRFAWFIITTAAFLSSNFWVYMFATFVVAWLSLQRERNPMALYMGVLFAVPLFMKPIPGFGIVNYFFDLNHQRVLSLVIMLPIALQLLQSKDSGDRLQRTIHLFVLTWVALNVGHWAINDSATMTMRVMAETLLSVWLPFYVCSRNVSSVKQLREVMTMAVVGMSVMGLIAVFETIRGWHVYETLRDPLGVRVEAFSSYILREGAGFSFLRALGPTAASIVFGQMFMIATCFWVGLRTSLAPKWHGYLVLGILLAGSLATFSRGPWLGTIIGVFVFAMSGPGVVKRFLTVSMVAIVALVILLVTPFGNTILQFMPFVGNVESQNVDYRVRLFEVSMLVFWDNPIFGSFKPLMDYRMETLRQGQGIIDLVNHYVAVGLYFGFVGIFIFFTPYLIAMWHVFRSARMVEQYSAVVGMTGRALLGAMVAVLFSLATASLLDFIPVLLWMMLGLSCGYVTNTRRVIAQHRAAAMQSAMVSAQRARGLQGGSAAPDGTTTPGVAPGVAFGPLSTTRDAPARP